MNNTQISITSSFNLANRRFRCQWKAIESARSAKPSKLHVLHSIVVNVTLKLKNPSEKQTQKAGVVSSKSHLQYFLIKCENGLLRM